MKPQNRQLPEEPENKNVSKEERTANSAFYL
jgi:hypothetical protein